MAPILYLYFMKYDFKILFLAAWTIMGSCGCSSSANDNNEEDTVTVELVSPPDLIPEGSSMDASPAPMMDYPAPLLPFKETNEKVTDIGNPLDKNFIKEKKIIKDGNIAILTKDIEGSKKKLDEQLSKLNGYYENEDLKNNDSEIIYNLKVRVPAGNFEKLLSFIEKGEGELLGKTIQARDVTEEFEDTETRLANKREYLKRYRDLLSKSKSVKDILEIEENIRTLLEEIESTEGHLRYLSDQVAYSALYISLEKDKPFVYIPKAKDKFSERVRESLARGWDSLVGFFIWTISIWPFIVLIIFGVVVFKRIRKSRRMR